MSSEDAVVGEPVRPDRAGEVRRVEVDGQVFLNEEVLFEAFDSEQTAITWGRAVAFLRAPLGSGGRFYDLGRSRRQLRSAKVMNVHRRKSLGDHRRRA